METLIHSKVRISFTYLFAEVNYLIKISDHIKVSPTFTLDILLQFQETL